MRDITDCKSEINLYGGTEVKRTYHIDGQKIHG